MALDLPRGCALSGWGHDLEYSVPNAAVLLHLLDGVCVVLFLAARHLMASLLRQPALLVLVWFGIALYNLVGGGALAFLRRLAVWVDVIWCLHRFECRVGVLASGDGDGYGPSLFCFLR